VDVVWAGAGVETGALVGGATAAAVVLAGAGRTAGCAALPEAPLRAVFVADGLWAAVREAVAEGESAVRAVLLAEGEAEAVPGVGLLDPADAASAVLGGAVLTNKVTRATVAKVPAPADRQVIVEMRRRP
jgi:hypothetical protein